MVAHNLTDISFFLSTKSGTRRSSLEANVPVVESLIGPFVVPINKMQMKPRLMMAALIIRSQAKSFPRDGECTMLTYFPETLRAGWFEKSTDVCPVVRDGSGSPQRGGARWRRQGTIRKGFINSRLSRLRQRHAVPLKSPATKSTSWEIIMARRVRMSFLAMPFFLA